MKEGNLGLLSLRKKEIKPVRQHRDKSSNVSTPSLNPPRAEAPGLQVYPLVNVDGPEDPVPVKQCPALSYEASCASCIYPPLTIAVCATSLITYYLGFMIVWLKLR